MAVADELELTPAEVAVIPVIDLGPFLAGEHGAVDDIATEMRRALTEIGFFFIVNHGVDWSLIEGMYEQAQRFHSMPLAAKDALRMSAANTGYVGMEKGISNASRLGVVKKPNLNEAFFMKRDWPDGHPRAINQWPTDLVGFRQALVEFFDTMETLGLQLLPVYARAFGMPDGFLEPLFVDGEITQRLSRYPPVDPEVDQWGLAPHTDGGFITFLAANDVPGLWIRPAGHDWLQAPYLPESFLINSGDMLRRWTNDRFLSTEHRVLNESGADRYAVPFFHSPAADTLVECMPSFVDDDHPPLHEPVIYGDYLRWFMSRNYHGLDEQEAP